MRKNKSEERLWYHQKNRHWRSPSLAIFDLFRSYSDSLMTPRLQFPRFSVLKARNKIQVFMITTEKIKNNNFLSPTCLLISLLMSSYALSLDGKSRSKDSWLCDFPLFIVATGLACQDACCPAGTSAGSNPSHTSNDKLSPIPLSERTASRCVAPRRLVPLT